MCGGYYKRVPIIPLSNQITRIEPRAASADCHGTSPLRRRGFIPILAFLGEGYRGLELNKLSEEWKEKFRKQIDGNYADAMESCD